MVNRPYMIHKILATVVAIALLSSCTANRFAAENTADADRVISGADASRMETDGVPNFQGIADVLGCVFAPQNCKKDSVSDSDSE